MSRSCRVCGAELTHVFVDLGTSPLANHYLSESELVGPETFYPLKAWICSECLLVQLEQFTPPDRIFSDYAYFSSFSDTWLEHAHKYVEMAVHRFGLGRSTQVVEVGSNDGYLLRWFVERGIPSLGIEPAANVAATAVARGIPTRVAFLGKKTAEALVEEGIRAKLLIGNNVLAHVPDLNDFIAGLRVLLARSGVITMEFPHVVRLMEEHQFDTIYHEHFSYFSLTSVEKAFARHALTIVDVEELPTHGGSLRIFARHSDDPAATVGHRVAALKAREARCGYCSLERYQSFEGEVQRVRHTLLTFLLQARREGKVTAAYGAPAKGNTLLNYCGVRADLVSYTVDRSHHKQGRYLPGTRIPIRHPDYLRETRPDYLLILPWNLREEIMIQMSHVRDWGCKFVVPIPSVQVLS